MGTVVFLQGDKLNRAMARRCGFEVVDGDWERLPAGNCLIVGSGVRVPWGLVPAGFGFMGPWDVAAPMFSYGKLAQDEGTPAERSRTEAIILDLRQLLYDTNLVFVSGSAAARDFVAIWRKESEGANERLAFLRALHLVKPRFCALPRSWIAERDTMAGEVKSSAISGRRATGPSSAPELVRVEVAPGRFIRCYPGNEDKVRAEYELKHMSRAERRRRGL
jgi:hypothetical protein